jgi:hypothetical protein
MKLKSFIQFITESRGTDILDNSIGIQEFLESIEISANQHDHIVEWWRENRASIRIHYFRFTSVDPIMGVFLSEGDIAINSKVSAPGWMKLFLALHESRHCDQHAKGIIMPGYWDTVVAGEEDLFLEEYFSLEKDANDFAIESMVEMGFEREMRESGSRLRGNEGAGKIVYQMMRRDIQKYQPTDFIDLLKMQILQ